MEEVMKISYVGNKYACIIDNYFETGGGTYRVSESSVKLYDIAITYTIIMVMGVRAVKLQRCCIIT